MDDTCISLLNFSIVLIGDKLTHYKDDLCLHIFMYKQNSSDTIDIFGFVFV